MVFVTLSAVQHCAAEQYHVPNIFDHEYHQWFLLDQLSTPLLLSWVDNTEGKAGANPNKAAAVPHPNADKLEERRLNLGVE